MSAVPPVYVIVLNYRGADDTIACLNSLAKLDYPDVRLIVVDNASGDGSVEKLKTFQKNFEKKSLLIESPASAKRRTDQLQRELVTCIAMVNTTIPMATDDQKSQLKWKACQARSAPSPIVPSRNASAPRSTRRATAPHAAPETGQVRKGTRVGGQS